MTKISRIDVVNSIVENSVIIEFSTQSIDDIFLYMQTYAEKGRLVFTIKHTDNQSIEILKKLIKRCEYDLPNVIIGASSISDIQTATLYLEAQVDFISGTNSNELIARKCNRFGVLYIPLCQNSNDINNAIEFGLEIVQFTIKSYDELLKTFEEIERINRSLIKLAVVNQVNDNSESIILDNKEYLNQIDGLIIPIPESINEQDGSNSDNILTRKLNLIGTKKSPVERNLFFGIEHIGLYQTNNVPAKEIAKWYSNIFGFRLDELTDCFLLEGYGFGRIEVVKHQEQKGVHIAVLVQDMEESILHLSALGIETEPIVKLPDISWTYLKQTDPLGNRVHLVWRKMNGFKKVN